MKSGKLRPWKIEQEGPLHVSWPSPLLPVEENEIRGEDLEEDAKQVRARYPSLGLSPTCSSGVLPLYCTDSPALGGKNKKYNPTKRIIMFPQTHISWSDLHLPSQISLKITVSLSFTVPSRVITDPFLGTGVL